MKRTKHSLSHYKNLTFSMGELIPVAWFEGLPGDTVQMSSTVLMRVLPQLAPVMHPVHVRIHHWFVPNRLIWANFADKFITGGEDGMDATSHPTISSGGGGFAAGALGDYLGVPPGIANLSVNALPFRAYTKIFNRKYRDQDLVTARTENTGDGADATTPVTIANVAWQKDPYTSARPWTQKGPAVTLPLGTRANVRGLGILESDRSFSDGSSSVRETGGSAAVTYNPSRIIQATDNAAHRIVMKGTADPGVPDVYADLSTATGVSIPTVREYFALQRYEEARAMWGSRYVEYLRYCGVTPADSRLGEPEYLGGGKQTISWSEIVQAGPNFDANTGVGTLRGHGIGAAKSNRFRYYCQEHGIFMSLLSVKPTTMYVNGLPKKFSRETREDYYQKELESIGMEEVLNKEVYAGDTGPNDVFGYQDRYYSYRHEPSQVAGDFRTTLNMWHQGRIFAADVALNSAFVTSDPTTRIFASTSTDNLLAMCAHSIQMRRYLARPRVGRVG